jgi:DNA repair photolyase
MEYISIESKHVLKRAKKSSEYQCGHVLSPYKGCEYGCTYCPGHLEGDLHDKVWVNINTPNILKKELKNVKKNVMCVVGYQPAEKIYRVIQKILNVLKTKHYPVHILTRSDIVLDDLDILSKINQESWCCVSFCVPTMDIRIANIFEPNAPSPNERMAALEKVKTAGIRTGVIISPMIPFITDSEAYLKKIVEEAEKRKADYVIPEILTLEDNYRSIMVQTIKRHYPKLLIKYKQLYELGPQPDVRYTRNVKRRINRILEDRSISSSIPKYSEGTERKQVNLENFFTK